jgi:hypothetical protein
MAAVDASGKGSGEMKLMLAVIFFCVVMGLVVKQIGRRETLVIAGVALVMSTLYLASLRFM